MLLETDIGCLVRIIGGEIEIPCTDSDTTEWYGLWTLINLPFDIVVVVVGVVVVGVVDDVVVLVVVVVVVGGGGGGGVLLFPSDIDSP